jgi:hypothetical protein
MHGLRIPLLAVLLVILLQPPATPAEEPVTLSSLLDEMIDRDRLARFPDPAYTCRQFSSYDRASVSSGNQETWFANRDHGQHLRVEQREGREEWVMMDAEGPGAVVRFWSANPKGMLRIYLDHGGIPVIEAPMADVLDGRWNVPPPLAAERSRGHNLYLPIPYAGHCKITCDEEDFYYQINYRTYEKGTKVETLTPEILSSAAGRIADTGEALLLQGDHAPEDLLMYLSHKLRKPLTIVRDDGEESIRFMNLIEPGESLRVALPAGSKVIRQIEISRPDPTDAVRSLVLEGTIDGIQTIWCPLVDFIGAGAGAGRVKDFYRVIEKGNNWKSLWSMPYREKGELAITNLGKTPVSVSLGCIIGDWSWDGRSMHFYARWRHEHPIPTLPMKDWNYVAIQGKGVFAGDTLAVMNPVSNWWGEGDEKIYVDSEEFPSHFGTGTEDYYGYAWCCNEPFEAPFHGQPRCDGYVHANNWGHTTVSRVRALDAIPFLETFRFDMEVWHWHKECEVGYGATTFFYALPGAEHNRAPQPEAAAAPIPEPPPLPPPYKIDGAIECEDMAVSAKSDGLPVLRQNVRGFGDKMASNNFQIWIQGRAPGDFVELEIPVERGGKHRVVLHALRSWDYGIMRFSVNGQRAGEDIDLFNGEARAVAATGPLDLGTFEPVKGRITLRAEVVGGHPRSEGTKSYFGLDCVVVTPLMQKDG